MSGSFLRSMLSHSNSVVDDWKSHLGGKMNTNNNSNSSTSNSSHAGLMSELLSSMGKIGLSSGSGDFVTRCDADAPPLPPSLPPAPGSSGEASSETVPLVDDIEKAAAEASNIENPGPYEQASGEAKRLVTLDTTDGARFDISKQLSPHMLVQHSFWLGTSMLPEGKNTNYTFVTQVVSEDGKVLVARLDPEKKSLDGRIMGGPARLQISVSPEGQSDQLLAELDLGANTWTANVKYGSMGGAMVFGANYYQAVTSRLAVGGEGMYLAANKGLMSSYTARYNFCPSNTTEPSSTMVGQWNPSQQTFTLNYKQNITPKRVNVGAELQCNPLAPDQSTVAIGAEFNLTRSKVNLAVGGDGRIQTVVETKLGMAHGSPTLNFSANIHHATSDMKFGYGLNIGG